MAMSEEEKTLTAYHEAGHAIVGRLVPEHDPVYKVTIIPRGRALGVTMYLPEGDKYSYNRTAIESQLCSLYGGRVAEELIFGEDKVRSEEHTSELQSLMRISYAVFCLKKKKTQTTQSENTTQRTI